MASKTSKESQTLKELVEAHNDKTWDEVASQLLQAIEGLDQLDIEDWHMKGMVPDSYQDVVRVTIGLPPDGVDLVSLRPAGMTQEEKNSRDAAWDSFKPGDDDDFDEGVWEEAEAESEPADGGEEEGATEDEDGQEGEGSEVDGEDVDVVDDTADDDEDADDEFSDIAEETETEADVVVETDLNVDIDVLMDSDTADEADGETVDSADAETVEAAEVETVTEAEETFEPEIETDFEPYPEPDFAPEPVSQSNSESEFLGQNIEKIVAITTSYISSDEKLKKLIRRTVNLNDDKTALGKVVYTLLVEDAARYVDVARGITERYDGDGIKLGVWVGRRQVAVLDNIAVLLKALLSMRGRSIAKNSEDTIAEEIADALGELDGDDYELIARMSELDFTGENLG